MTPELAGAFRALLRALEDGGALLRFEAAPSLETVHRHLNRLFAAGRERECWAEVAAVEREIARYCEGLEVGW